MTYGLLSKVLSPKRVRERAKLAMEKKKSGGAGGAPQPGDDAGDREEEAAVQSWPKVLRMTHINFQSLLPQFV